MGDEGDVGDVGRTLEVRSVGLPKINFLSRSMLTFLSHSNDWNWRYPASNFRKGAASSVPRTASILSRLAYSSAMSNSTTAGSCCFGSILVLRVLPQFEASPLILSYSASSASRSRNRLMSGYPRTHLIGRLGLEVGQR